MRLYAYVSLLVLLSGCIGGENVKFVCPGGSVVDDMSQCPRPTTTTTTTTTTSTASTTTTSTTSTTGTTYMTTTTTTTSSVTTTTDKCGNGVLDAGEGCDVGSVCQQGDGACRIVSEGETIAFCMYNGFCDYNTQTYVSGKYTMGQCKGCYGPKTRDKCKCIGDDGLTRRPTTSSRGPTTTWSRGPTTTTTLEEPGPEDDFHYECKSGNCVKVLGPGEVECLLNDACRHKVCSNDKCTEVMEVGDDECEENQDCYDTNPDDGGDVL